MIDESTEAKLLDAFRMLLRAKRENIEIILKPQDTGKLQVLIGMPPGEPQPKWLTNSLADNSQRITIAAMAMHGAAATALMAQDMDARRTVTVEDAVETMDAGRPN